jgi:tRNA (cmo5U34)-methyltransferase
MKIIPLEEMSAFFNTRIDGYEAHMLREGKKTYVDAAKLVPVTPGLKLLDLGCGTGLELDEIFKINPTVQVTGIDLAEKMLEKLRQKHAARKNQLNLILADYFSYDFGKNQYDVALSVQTLHHFPREEKIGLYIKIRSGLKPHGFYIESDYMAPTQEFEDSHFSAYRRLRAGQGITAGFYHYDIPYTVENQVEMLQKAGFSAVEIVSHEGNGAVLVARKLVINVIASH